MGVNRLSCEGVVSTTDTPGAAETVCVPVGYAPDGENAQVQITAQVVPDQSPDWPNGAPAWTGVAASDGTTATVSTEIAGTYTVSCAYGNMKSLVVQVIGIGSTLVRRVDQGKLAQPPPFASSTAIAAGGLDNDVHKADLEFRLNPIPTGTFSLPIKVVVTNADGYPDEPVPATLCVDGTPVFTGSGTATITFTNANTSTTTGICPGTLVSSNRMTAHDAPCTVGGASIAFLWDCAGAYDFQCADYFVPEQADDIHAFLTLQEVAGLDEDGDGTAGEGAIGGHDLAWFPSAVTVLFWRYDYATDTYDVLPQTAVVSWGTDYGPADFEVVSTEDGFSVPVTVDSLVQIGDRAEPVAGHYSNSQTVHDYVLLDSTAEEVVIVLAYTFAFQDEALYGAPTTP